MENKITLSQYFDTVFDCCKSDKGTYHSYIQKYYTNIFTDLRDSEIKLLEIGILNGQSIKLWNDWFSKAEIIGMDINKQSKNFVDANRYNVIWENAYTDNSLSNFENNYFDFIIDDGPHTLETQLYLSTNYFYKLKIGGLLIIEDIFDFNYINQIKEHVNSKLPFGSYEFNFYDYRNVKGRFDDIIIEIKRLA